MTDSLDKEKAKTDGTRTASLQLGTDFIVPNLWSCLHVPDLRDSFVYEAVLSLQ